MNGRARDDGVKLILAVIRGTYDQELEGKLCDEDIKLILAPTSRFCD